MRQLQPVIWSKGTFLTPQHLQTRDRFLESVLQFRLEALNFCPWGFPELRVDHEALGGGNFALTRAVGMFPDGLPFDIPDSDPAAAAKPLRPTSKPIKPARTFTLPSRTTANVASTFPLPSGTRTLAISPKWPTCATRTPAALRSRFSSRGKIYASWWKASRARAAPICASRASNARQREAFSRILNSSRRFWTFPPTIF